MYVIIGVRLCSAFKLEQSNVFLARGKYRINNNNTIYVSCMILRIIRWIRIFS